MERKSKPMLDTLDVKILKAIEKKSKPMMKYPKGLRITHSTFRVRVHRMIKNNWIKVNSSKIVGTSRYPIIQQKGKKVLKFAETYF